MVDDKRRHERFAVEGIHCRILSAAEIEIIDISIGGTALFSYGRLDIGKEYTLKLEENGRTCSVKGTIVWSVLSGSRKNTRGDVIPVYKAGMKFKDAQSQNAEELLRFIEKHKKFHDQRMIVRFSLEKPERAMLNVPLNFTVKKVSLGGALIETERPFTVNETFPMEFALDEGKTITCTGRIASCLAIGRDEPPRYDVGVEFLEVPEDSRDLLRAFIKSL